MSNRKQSKDEEILAKIIAGGMESGRVILDQATKRKRGLFTMGFNIWGVSIGDSPQGPACAIGAGCLYYGLTDLDNPITSFAKAYRVAYAYAWGVSDGFEDQTNGSAFLNNVQDKDDYLRGMGVGSAVREYFGNSGRNGE